MATDITTELMQIIGSSYGPQSGLQNDPVPTSYGIESDVLGNMANWYQILGTTLGPVLQKDVIQALQQQGAAATTSGAAVEAGAASAAAGGVALAFSLGAGLILAAIGAILGALAGSDDSSGFTEAFQALSNGILDLLKNDATSWLNTNLTTL